jgi:uncharacterized protein (TIGR02421 family)
MVWSTTKEKVKRLSQRIVEAQRPIRVLDAIKWDPSFESELRKRKFKSLPVGGPELFEKNTLGFDPKQKLEEFKDLIGDIQSSLGNEDDLGALLVSICEQYRDVVRLLQSRGTEKFGEYSRKLYGSPKDCFFDESRTVSELGRTLYEILSGIDDAALGAEYPKELEATAVVDELNSRFDLVFGADRVKAKLSDGILADAAAGGDTVKIKDGSRFSRRDIDILEVHEGWVHVGTTLNGNHQHVARWLSKGPPRCSSTQEGLAVLMEIFTFRSYPRRARQINDRIIGIEKAQEGANLLEVIEFYRTEGYSEDECLANALRVFRGGVIEGGAPFTKDLAYCRGFVENYNFMRAAIRGGKPQLIPFLFVGKLSVEDVPLLYRKHQEGIVDAPVFLPPQFADLNGVAVWMSFSSFLSSVNLSKVQEHYDRLFKKFV